MSKIVTNADPAAPIRHQPSFFSLRNSERERQHQRIHFHSTPQNARTGLLLFKRTFQPLLNDSDAPLIGGIDNALLCAAESDMLEGQRQYGKAQAKMQEAVAMIGTMQDLERQQSANLIRIIPCPEPDPVCLGASYGAKDHFLV